MMLVNYETSNPPQFMLTHQLGEPPILPRTVRPRKLLTQPKLTPTNWILTCIDEDSMRAAIIYHHPLLLPVILISLVSCTRLSIFSSGIGSDVMMCTPAPPAISDK